jgi:hypothetical protein
VTFSQAKKLQNAPKRVWRRETLHTLEGRASPCPNTVLRGTQPERAVGNDIPLETREMRVHVTAVTVGRHWSYSSWRTAPSVASATWTSSEPQPEGSVRLHPGRCVHVERGQKGERVELKITKNDLGIDSRGRNLRVTTRKRHGGTRSRSSAAFASQGRKSCGLWSLGSESGLMVAFGWPSRVWLRESVKMVHRAYPGATIERERQGQSWQRLNKLVTTSTVGQHPRR